MRAQISELQEALRPVQLHMLVSRPSDVEDLQKSTRRWAGYPSKVPGHLFEGLLRLSSLRSGDSPDLDPARFPTKIHLLNLLGRRHTASQGQVPLPLLCVLPSYLSVADNCYKLSLGGLVDVLPSA